MLFYGAVRRFTARLLHVFKTEKAYPTAVSVLEVYVAFVLFSFFFPTVVLLGSSPGSTTRELSIFPCFTALVEAQAPILPRHWRAYAHGKDLLLFLPLEQTRRLPACPPALCGGPCWEPPGCNQPAPHSHRRAVVASPCLSWREMFCLCKSWLLLHDSQLKATAAPSPTKCYGKRWPYRHTGV